MTVNGAQLWPVDAASQPDLDFWVRFSGFEYSKKVIGYIQGFKRVFYQGSTDHRGTPEAPGRTVTLVEQPGCVTWGAAFSLAGDSLQQAATLKYLEWREKQYDRRCYVDVFTCESADSPAVVGALTYIATSNRSANKNWLGPASQESIARQIAVAVGPSGPNYIYLYRLADCIREMCVEDEELFALEARVRQIRAVLAAQSLCNGQTTPGL